MCTSPGIFLEMRHAYITELRKRFSKQHSELIKSSNSSLLSMVVEENILIFSTEAEEYNENLHKVALLLRGECGLLFTNEKTEDVLEFFQNLAEPDYAR